MVCKLYFNKVKNKITSSLKEGGDNVVKTQGRKKNGEGGWRRGQELYYYAAL